MSDDVGEVAKLLAGLRQMTLPGHYVGHSAAISELRRYAKWTLEEDHLHGYAQDASKYPDYDPLPVLLHAMAMWTAADLAEPHGSKPPRCPCNPTSPEGREWFRAEIWDPFLRGLGSVCVRDSLSVVRDRARRILIDLATGRRKYDTAFMIRPLRVLLGGGVDIKKPVGRPPKSVAERALAYVQAIDRYAPAANTWFPLSHLEAHGIRNPRANWNEAVRAQLVHHDVECRWQRSVHSQPQWEIRRVSGNSPRN